MEPNFDYSLNEEYTNVKYHVEIYHISNIDDHKKDLAKLMSDITTGKNIKLVLRKDYQCPKSGQLLIHMEWFSYELRKVSPHINTIVNPHVLPC